jgi:hypothetical protein
VSDAPEALRFRRGALNPRLCPLDEGDAFQRFVAELFESEYPGIHVFAGRGNDGCIDLAWPPDATETVFECKTAEEDGRDAAFRIWRGVSEKLDRNLATPERPPAGQGQFLPWYRTDPPVSEYVFCLSSVLANENQRRDLRDEIQGFFKDLAKRHRHLRHLELLRVVVRDWEDLSSRLAARPHLLFRWFPNARPRGLVPLGEEPTGGRFSEYLTSARLPYYARREHLESHPAPAGREILDEEGLLASFEATGARGLVITGGGGFGKTRLMYELGRLSQRKGWSVFRVQGSLRTDALEVLAERLRPETPALVLLDYIEIQPTYGDWVETLELLADERKLPLRYIACCRSSFYPSIQLIGRHRRVDLFPQTLDAEADRWLEGFRESTVRHIVERTGVPSPERVVEMSRATPVLAVFAAWLHAQGKKGDLEELLAEPDFGTWVHKRVRQSFREASVSRDLARLVAMFPLPDKAIANLKETEVRLLDTLARDGWVEKVEQEGRADWAVVHDVLADQVLVSYVATIPASAAQFVRELLDESARIGGLDSALTALQRVGAHAVLKDLLWEDLIGAAMDRHPNSWRAVRLLVVRFALLVASSLVALLARNQHVWEGAEKETEFQNALGWMAREVAENRAKESVRSALVPWLKRAAPHVTTSNFLLTQGLRIDAVGLRQPALVWLWSHPGLFQTHYLIRAWLLVGHPASDIVDVVTIWNSRLCTSTHASFVFQAWLDAGGEKDLVRSYVSAWLAEHGKLPEAEFVLKAWLEAGGEKDLVRSHVSAWLPGHGRTHDACFVLTPWLEAGGEKDLVRSYVSAWLAEYGKLPEAQFVLKAWLDAGGEKDLVRSYVSAWLAEHGKLPEAQFVLKAWLDTGGEKDLVRSYVSTWLAEHGTLPEARFVLKTWLDAGGEKDLVRSYVSGWLTEHGKLPESRFVLTGWLEARGEKDLVRSYVSGWLTEHGNLPESQFVLTGWLEARGEKDLVRSHLTAWLDQHSQAPDADFVLRAWLGAKGEFDLVREPTIQWLSEHYKEQGAVFVTKFLARQRNLEPATVRYILTWCRSFSQDPDALWRLVSLNLHLLRPEITSEVVTTCKLVVGNLLDASVLSAISRALLATLFATLSRTVGTRKATRSLFIRWLRHPGSLAPLPLESRDVPVQLLQSSQRPSLLFFVTGALAEGTLSFDRDRPALSRFFSWVGTWRVESQEAVRRILVERSGSLASLPAVATSTSVPSASNPESPPVDPAHPLPLA